MSPAWAGGFLTAAPPGKPYIYFIDTLSPNHITSRKKSQDWSESKAMFLYYVILFTHIFYIGNYEKGKDNYTYLVRGEED